MRGAGEPEIKLQCLPRTGRRKRLLLPVQTAPGFLLSVEIILLSVVITLSHTNTDWVHLLDDKTHSYTGRAADPPSGVPRPPVESGTHVWDKMPRAQDTRQDSTTGS